MWQLNNSKMFISFYTEEEYLTFCPIYNGEENLKITLDNEIIMPTVLKPYAYVTLKQSLSVPSGKNMGITSYKNYRFNDINDTCIVIPNKGWHTLCIESTGTGGLWVSGFIIEKASDFIEKHNICTSYTVPDGQNLYKGYQIFNDTLNKMMFLTDGGWRDSTGTLITLP